MNALGCEPRISSASFSYPQTSSEKRAELALQLRPERSNISAFVLSTCLRLEIAVEGDLDVLADVMTALFDKPPDIADARLRCDQEAASHLFRVVAGLESPIPGEHEILAQFRSALQDAEQAGCVSGLFLKLLQESICVGRKVRFILPDQPHTSLAAVAAGTVAGADRVAVLGSGTMCSAVVRALKELPSPPRVTVVARTPENVSDVNVDIWSFDRAAEALQHYPAIISATSAKYRPVSDFDVENALSSRTEQGVLVDMAMPPDFEIPPQAALQYADIDELARLAGPQPNVEQADEFVAVNAAKSYQRFVNHHAVGPLVVALMEYADSVVSAAVDRFGSRLGSAEDVEVLRLMARDVARTMLAQPLKFLRSGEDTQESVQLLAAAFGVEPWSGDNK